MPRGYLSSMRSWISFIILCEKLDFLHYSVREVIYALIDVLGHFSVICNHQNFCKVELTYTCSADIGQQEKSQKYFDLSTFN